MQPLLSRSNFRKKIKQLTTHIFFASQSRRKMMAVRWLCDGLDLFLVLSLDMSRWLCDGGEPRRLWLDEDSGGGWIRMTAAAVGLG